MRATKQKEDSATAKNNVDVLYIYDSVLGEHCGFERKLSTDL